LSSSASLLLAELLDTIESAFGLLFKKLCIELRDFHLLLDETTHEGFAVDTDAETIAAEDDNALAGKTSKDYKPYNLDKRCAQFS
jgi:hypothetical protein